MKSLSAPLSRLAILGVLIAFVPLSATGAHDAPAARQEVFFTRLFADTVAVTAGSFLGAGSRMPSGIQPFNEPAINGGLADLVKIRNGAGDVVGFGIQLETWTPGDNGRPRPEYPTSWTLVLPGRGTLFLHEIENPTRLFQMVSAARSAPQPWHGHIDERTTIGPGPGGAGVIVGGTGEFEGRRGTFIETDQFTAFGGDGTGASGADATAGAVGSTTLTLTYSN